MEGMVWSRDGYCRSFDANASGTYNANAGACFLLKPLDQVKPHETIHCVISGIGVSNDGNEKMSFDAPSPAGQEAAIRAAQRDAELSAAADSQSQTRVSYIECHGTGTALGDPIELSALESAYAYGDANAKLTVGSMKANIGHANTAAGALGFLKMALQLKHKMISPIAHFTLLNKVANEGGAHDVFDFPVKANAWDGEHRSGAVSSFGIGGTNVHVVVEAALERETRAMADRVFERPPNGDTPAERVVAFFVMATRGNLRRPNLTRAMFRASAAGEPALAQKVGIFHDLMLRMVVGALRGEPIAASGAAEIDERERLLGEVLNQIWFAVMINWSSGCETQASINERMSASVELVLDGANRSS